MSEPSPTRPRSERARTAILAATRDLVAEVGYEQMSIEGIAARAHVGKQTIYRWWKSKSAILAECVLEGLILPSRELPPDTGDLRDDLLVWFRGALHELGDPANASLLRGLVSAAADDPDLAAVLYERLTGPQEASMAARLREAEADGEIDSALTSTAVIEMLFGTIVYRILSRLDVGPDLADGLIDTLFDGLRGAK
ncbi:TetR family transcriptional regulator [Frondihabitans sucicola]|uniref:TetR family transcriptional regulator n=1 Tax=Frondihabitans sucicola TaxID=1268041 RepID=A0ABM8GJK6_9MICO|nr:TetR/AcrR family transcriptional regulator [Frondihabitans sucicola]BDZ48563.1 TetR family transcriptional regulator [Frondihabitans sucicola]